MKATVELPDSLMREVKLRAVYEGRRLKDMVADLLPFQTEFKEPMSLAASSAVKGSYPPPPLPGADLSRNVKLSPLSRQVISWLHWVSSSMPYARSFFDRSCSR